jgi:hypothetical protein
MPSNAQPSTSLHLLAPDGIVHVTFARPLSGDESVALLNASQAAQTVDELEHSLKYLGNAWGLPTTTAIVSRKREAAKRDESAESSPMAGKRQ